MILLYQHPGLVYTNHADYLTKSDKPYRLPKPEDELDKYIYNHSGDKEGGKASHDQVSHDQVQEGGDADASLNQSDAGVKKVYKCPHCSKVLQVTYLLYCIIKGQPRFSSNAFMGSE